MTHPAIDEEGAARLRAQLAGPEPGAGPAPAAAAAPSPQAEPPLTSGQKVKAAARKAAVPVIARVRQELDRAGAEDLADLRAEVAALRAEVARIRAEHAAELAALHEELAAVRPKPRAQP